MTTSLRIPIIGALGRQDKPHRGGDHRHNNHDDDQIVKRIAAIFSDVQQS